MTEKPYTDADVELVAGWFRRWLGASTIRQRDRDCAIEILGALAAAGRLLPADARLAIEDALIASERQRWGDVPDRVAIAEWADEIHGRLAGQPEERR